MNPSGQQSRKHTSNAFDAAPQALLHKDYVGRYGPLRSLFAQRKQLNGCMSGQLIFQTVVIVSPIAQNQRSFRQIPQKRLEHAHIAVGGGRQIGFHGIAFQGAEQVDFEAIEAALFGGHIAVVGFAVALGRIKPRTTNTCIITSNGKLSIKKIGSVV